MTILFFVSVEEHRVRLSPSHERGYINASWLQPALAEAQADKTRDVSSEGEYQRPTDTRRAFGQRRYIATQGPLEESISHFWQMVWNHRVPLIIMLANIQEEGRRRKCEPYWPSLSDEFEFSPTPDDNGDDDDDDQREVKKSGTLRVRCCQDRLVAEGLIERRFELQSANGEVFPVTQLHYILWPDHGVPSPSTSFLHLIRYVQQLSGNHRDPMVVHCR